MVAGTTGAAIAVAGGTATAGAYLGFDSYIPFLMGGVALLGYMVSNDEVELKSTNALYIILGAILIGYFTKAITPTVADVITHLLTTTVGVEITKHSVTLQNGEFTKNLSDIMSFILAGLSRNLFLKFFDNKDTLVDAAIDKLKDN